MEGAEKGDILKVKILEIALPANEVTRIASGAGVLGELVEEDRTRMSKVREDYMDFKNIKIPVRPNVGVIGVATAKDSYPTDTPWKHGGIWIRLTSPKVPPFTSLLSKRGEARLRRLSCRYGRRRSLCLWL